MKRQYGFSPEEIEARRINRNQKNQSSYQRRLDVKTPEQLETHYLKVSIKNKDYYKNLTTEEKQAENNFKRIDYKNKMESTKKTSYSSSLNLLWDYDRPCKFCGAIHFVCDTDSERNKCCALGKFFLDSSKYPHLRPLPKELRRVAVNKIRHFNKNCSYYNNALSIASIGVDNGRGGGFEKFNGESCVKLNGRTYSYLSSSARKGSGINYFTFDAIEDLQNSVNGFNKSMENKNSDRNINYYYMEKIFEELKHINPFAGELLQIGSEIKCSSHTNQKTLHSIINTKTHHFEIGSIISDNSSGSIIFKYKLKNSTFNISSASEKVEPLCFPLLFPYGENGFSTNIQKEVGCMKYMCSRWLMCDFIDSSCLDGNEYFVEINSFNEKSLIDNYDIMNTDIVYVKLVGDSKRVICVLNNDKSHFLPVSRFQIMTRAAQYHMVDLYSRSQDYKLNWHKNNQKLISGRDENLIFGQVEIDQQIKTKARLKNDRDIFCNSNPSFLAASYHGGPRHLKNCAIAALTVVSESSGPTVLITATVNPYWEEIQTMLLPGQTAYDRPEVVVRVFHRKLNRLIRNLRKGTYFDGMKVEYLMRVIEYQHRGFPHGHIVVKLIGAPEKSSDKEIICEFIDKYISAELPDSQEEPILCTICMDNMIHVCSNDINGCLDKNGKCKRQYDSIDLIDKTYINEKGYPKYRRRNKADLKVVPHHKKMLLDWNGHINVEFCASTFAVLYLYKYLFKGNRKVKIHFNNTSDLNSKDEINHFIRGRIISTMDTMWRGFGYQTYPATYPSVTMITCKLPEHVDLLLESGKLCDILVYFRRPPCLYHLKYTEFFNQYDYNYSYPKSYNGNNIIIDNSNNNNDDDNSDTNSDDSNDESNVIDNNINENRQNEDNKNVLFDISEKCLDILRNENEHRHVYIYKRVRQAKIITRMSMVNITMGEIFYLRTILLHVAVNSWNDILTVDNYVCETFQEAAVRRKLINEQTEALQSFEENMLFSSPTELRNMFVILTLQGHQSLCIYNNESLREKMYEDFYYDFSDSLAFHNKSICINKLLKELQSKFKESDKTLSQYGLPLPEQVETELQIERLRYDCKTEKKLYETMDIQSPNTAEQEAFMNDVLPAIRDSKTKIVYLQGDAGAGKTTIAKKVLSYTRSLGKIAIGCASTALAAKNYENFNTAHSLFHYPVIEDMEDIDNMSSIPLNLDMYPERKELIEAASVIIWDEAPSNELNIFLSVYKYFNYFKDKVIILIGDWKQCPPVIENGTMEDICKASILNSEIWDIFTVHEFTANLRINSIKNNICNRCTVANNCMCDKHQIDYRNMLVSIGNGYINHETVFPISIDDHNNNNNNKYNNNNNDNNSSSTKSNSKNNNENNNIDPTKPSPIDGSFTIKIPILKCIKEQNEAIKFVFPNLVNDNKNHNNTNYTDNNINMGNSDEQTNSKSAILCATNQYVDEWNTAIQLLNSNEPILLRSFDAFDYVDDPKNILQSMISDEILHRYNKTGVPPHILRLKVGDICFVMRNLLKRDGLTNNTRVKITDIKKYSIRVYTLDTNIPKFFIIPRIIFKVTLPYGRSFTMKRKQFPLRLAYSMTYNKSQGQELKRCVVDIRSPPFVHGHLYVALSRIRYFDDIRIYCSDENIDDDGIVIIKNYVYNQLRI